jgi:anaerobic magnesium-protoporphyrin IX monomethyl ester cyclase
MKVVLVRPPFYSLFGVTTPKMKTYPLNLLYLATYARDCGGLAVSVVDGENLVVPGTGADDRDPELVMHEGIRGMVAIMEDPEHWVWGEMERLILDRNPDLVGITCNSVNIDAARLMIRRLKRHDLPVILGGSHPTVLPEQSIRYTGADMAAQGEGERTLVGAAHALAGKSALSEIPSLAWRDKDRVTINPRGELISPIDDLPIPDRAFIDRSRYFGEVVMTGRGCPFNCSYCASRNIWGRGVRLRSVAGVIRELSVLKEQAELMTQTADSALPDCSGGTADHARPGRWVVKVVDDTFTVNRKRT